MTKNTLVLAMLEIHTYNNTDPSTHLLGYGDDIFLHDDNVIVTQAES